MGGLYNQEMMFHGDLFSGGKFLNDTEAQRRKRWVSDIADLGDWRYLEKLDLYGLFFGDKPVPSNEYIVGEDGLKYYKPLRKSFQQATQAESTFEEQEDFMDKHGKLMTETMKHQILPFYSAFQAGERLATPENPFKGETRLLRNHEFIQNADGSKSTEITITITSDEINEGRPTNIPSLWVVENEVKHVSELEAIRLAKESGLAFPSFETFDKAVDAAIKHSKRGGRKKGPLGK
jgi:hypothetical protein